MLDLESAGNHPLALQRSARSCSFVAGAEVFWLLHYISPVH